MNVEPGGELLVGADEFLRRLAQEAPVLSGVIRAADLGAPLPTCPGWTVRDVARHLGGIHRWVTRIVGEPVTEPWNPDQLEVVGSWPPDDELSDWLDEGLVRLIDALSAAPDDLVCFAPLPAPSPRAMWCRRQLHENTVHRVDIELAGNGGCSPVPVDVAVDCVDELLGSFVTRRRRGLVGVDGHATFVIGTTDAPAAWTVQSHPEGVMTTAGASVERDDTIGGTSEDLALVLWSRRSATVLDQAGSGRFLDAWNATVHVRYG